MLLPLLQNLCTLKQMHLPGSNIRRLRKHSRMTQQDLAAKAKVDQGQLSNIEKGSGGFSKESLQRIATALGVSVSVLFADTSVVDTALRGVRRIPVLQLSEVAGWKGPDERDLEAENVPFIYAALGSTSRFAFAVKISGTDNAPALDIGDDVIFDPAVMPWPGAMSIATSASGDAYIGRFRELEPERDATGPLFELVPMSQFHAAQTSRQKGGLQLRGVMLEQRKYVTHWQRK